MIVHSLKPPRSEPAAVSGKPFAKPRRRWLRALAVAAILALAAAAGGAYLARPTSVAIASVTRGEAIDAVYASGVVEYVRQARIAPVVTSPLRQVLVIEGQSVRAGQALAQLDDGPQMGTTLQLEAQADLARADARRTDRLLKAGFAAPAAAEDAHHRLAAAEAAARSARARLGDWRLTAPFGGQVLRRDAEPGDLATVGTPLFLIADTSALRVRAEIDERDVGRMAVGQTALLRSDAFAGRTFTARVSEITPQGDATGRVFRARLALAPETVLRPGMTVETNLITGRRSGAVLVPTAAIRDGAVWRLESGRARLQPVKVGAQGVDRTEVLSGLEPGVSVVLNPPATLKDGARLSVRSPP